ncbi:hypothetical protein BDZ97DRAFT_486581 [Flammula alnicola]|nr:hypothetical protein BDZ97DRAFT_486581 [Flammula alnicola]
MFLKVDAFLAVLGAGDSWSKFLSLLLMLLLSSSLPTTADDETEATEETDEAKEGFRALRMPTEGVAEVETGVEAFPIEVVRSSSCTIRRLMLTVVLPHLVGLISHAERLLLCCWFSDGVFHGTASLLC